MCPGEFKANLRLSLQEHVRQRRQDPESLGLQQPERLVCREAQGGDSRLGCAQRGLISHAVSPATTPQSGGGDRLQNPTWNPAEMGRKQMGTSAFPVTWQMLLRKPGSQLRRKNNSGRVERVSIYTVTAGPWELWCGRLLRPSILFWKIILPPGAWNLQPGKQWRKLGWWGGSLSASS